MTCKDCAHYEVCTEHHKVSHDWDARICHFFKDKSKFIELPKENDECYLFRAYYLDKQGKKHDHIIKTEEYLNFRIFDKDSLVYVAKGIFKRSYISLINSLVFSQKEQAEAKLKELNNNE